MTEQTCTRIAPQTYILQYIIEYIQSGHLVLLDWPDIAVLESAHCCLLHPVSLSEPKEVLATKSVWLKTRFKRNQARWLSAIAIHRCMTNKNVGLKNVTTIRAKTATTKIIFII